MAATETEATPGRLLTFSIAERTNCRPWSAFKCSEAKSKPKMHSLGVHRANEIAHLIARRVLVGDQLKEPPLLPHDYVNLRLVRQISRTMPSMSSAFSSLNSR